MGLRRSVFGIFFGLALATQASAADPPPLTPQFQQFATRPENRQVVVQVLQTQWNQTIGVACPNIAPVSWQVAMIQPVEFDAVGKPLKGAWKEIVRSEGCGFRKVFNVMSVVNTDGTVKHIGLLPGTSHADQGLQTGTDRRYRFRCPGRRARAQDFARARPAALARGMDIERLRCQRDRHAAFHARCHRHRYPCRARRNPSRLIRPLSVAGTAPAAVRRCRRGPGRS